MGFEDHLVIPKEAHELSGFRKWAWSEDFPEQGRIDYLQGCIEVDMAPEKLHSHGRPKTVLSAFIERVVSDADLGEVYVDRTRLVSDPADLHCEPDVLYVSWESLEAGRVRYLPSSPGEPDQLEVDGAADLVVEVVSNSSVGKDTKRLPPLYARAGVREFWLVDARGSELAFQIFHLQEGRYQPARADADGFQDSRVLGRRLRLRREPGRVQDTWRFFVDEV
jgi:Uma2 family endonuclease